MDEAFLQAIRADLDDDGPRLIYADWLDDHGDHDRAEFIRVECRRAALPHDHAESVDLAERRLELVARLSGRAVELSPALPPLFSFASPTWDEDYQRGFPSRAHAEPGLLSEEQVRAFCAGLEHLVSGTTIRHLYLRGPQAKQVGQVILGQPASAELCGLTIHGPESRYPGKGVLSGLARTTRLDRLTLLGLDLYTSDRTAEMERFTSADWFNRLRELWLWIGPDASHPFLLPRIAAIPNLGTFRCADLPVPGLQALADGFASLTRLELIQSSSLDPRQAVFLANARFPRLADLCLPQCWLDDGGLGLLLRADWFGQLRSLDLTVNKISNEGVVALAAAPAATELRVLRLGDNPFRLKGLEAIARSDNLRGLTTLDLSSHPYKVRDMTTAAIAGFLAALRFPRLRHLDLSGWPVGDDGAKVIAASPAFAGLTRLVLLHCGVSEAGRAALLAAEHLRGLVQLVV